VAGVPAARTLGRDPLGTLEVALLGDGVAPTDLYPLDIERALAALDRVATTVGERWWTRGIEPVGWIGAGEADLGSAWHHRVVAGQWDGLAVDLSWPGGLLATDRWLVPAGAREPDIAADLVAFALAAEVQAAFARETRMGPVNPDAFAFVEPWLRPTMPTSPDVVDSLVPLDGAWWAQQGVAARERFDRWFASRPLA
jgi:putative spermidine/putrescine transport system substrate-binding protein